MQNSAPVTTPPPPPGFAVSGLLLTATNRLARQLQAHHSQQRLAAGERAWRRPRILPWNAWLDDQIALLIDLGALDLRPLSADEELLLWLQIVTGASDIVPLLRPEAIAEQAAEAYSLLRQWSLSAADLGVDAGVDTETFAGWMRQFDGRCAARGWLPAAGRQQVLTLALQQGQLPVPGSLRLSGFDHHPPARRQLIDALQGAGCKIQEDSEDPPAVAARRVAARRVVADDSEAEARVAAQWARDALLQDPGSRIAMVVPDLAARRDQLQRVFSETLHPGGILPDAGTVPPLFDISLAQPLAATPLIDAALLLLRLASGVHRLADWSRLLRSPFLAGDEQEAANRARLELALRRLGRPELGIHSLAGQLTALADSAPCPRLAAAVTEVMERSGAVPARSGCSHWAEQVQELLQRWGWPGQRPLDSAEWQLHRRWQRLLHDFAGLDRIAGPLNYRTAVGQLARMAGRTLFQPEQGESPVQILGVLEAAGLQFDYCWLMGMDDDHWPPPAGPHPLLPTALQRRLQMPHATAEQELAYARLLTPRLLALAPEVLVSHARRDQDRDLGPSPLFARLPITELPSVPEPLATHDRTVRLEQLQDTRGPEAAVTATGGAQLLADQAACPFRAFAAHRLAARAPETPAAGLDPRLRGSLLHLLLEWLWQDLRDSDRLQQQSREELQALIAARVPGCLEEIRRQRPDLAQPRFLELESERLALLALEWLELEQRRETPFRVTQLEQREDIQVGGLDLRVRIDRLDRLPDGRLLVIDYKTGSNVRIQPWLQPRLQEPQLPLYAVTRAQQTAGAVLAQVRRGRCRFHGLTATAGVLPEAVVADDWPGQLQRWQQDLERLVGEYLRGEAAVMPQAGACDYCELPSLCRIDARVIEEPAATDE